MTTPQVRRDILCLIQRGLDHVLRLRGHGKTQGGLPFICFGQTREYLKQGLTEVMNLIVGDGCLASTSSKDNVEVIPSIVPLAVQCSVSARAR